MSKGMIPQLSPVQKQEQRYTLTYSAQLIPRMLAMNNLQMGEFIRKEADRNPCVELIFPQASRQDILEEVVAAAPDTDFRQDLILQLPPKEDEVVLRAAKVLIGQLDEYGFLPIDPEQVAFGAQKKILLRAMELIWAMEPAGVGARSLRECYLLQLHRIGKKGEDALALIRNEALFEAYENGQFANVCAVLNWGQSRLDEVTELLSRLSMRPVDETPTSEYIQADAEILRRADGGFLVQLCGHALPQVALSEAYLASMQNGGTRFANQGVYYANRLIFCIERRNATLLTVLQYAVERQMVFLEGGERIRLPMTEAARLLHISLPTVSRMLQNKYLRYQNRIFLAKELFCTGGTAELSRESAYTLIRRELGEECKVSPISDELLSRRLNEKYNVTLARRTIAKYRTALGIKPKSERSTP